MPAEIIDILSFQKFLEEKVFQGKNIIIKKNTRGGNSLNFLAQTEKNVCFIKLLPTEDSERIEYLRSILTIINHYPSFYSAHLCPDVPQFLNYQNFCVLIMNFIFGRKLKYYQLTPKVISSIAATYREFSKIPFAEAGLALPDRSALEIYESNQEEIEKLLKSRNFRIKHMAARLLRYNQLFFNSIPEIKENLALIHGDASLNNMLCDDNGKIAFLDLELMRFGHPVEDAAELILSSLLSHAVFFTPQERIRELTEAVDETAGFSAQEWQYGICMHYLYYICRRLRGGKLFKSYRKDWLVLQYLRKFKVIYAMFKSSGSAI